MAKQSSIRTLSAGSIGNFGETYDFAVFGFSVPILSAHFFPGSDRTAALLNTFAVYAVAFFARPLGGLMFGVIADKLRALLVSAPQEIRDRLLKVKTVECVEGCARLRSLGKTPMLQTLTTTLRLLAKRWLTLAEELKALDAMLDSLTNQHARRIRERFGVGPQTAAVLVAVAGDNPERLKNEAALAALCGTTPLQASSGKTVRHRLNRGGDRSAINALWTIAMVRMRSDPRTRAYVERRTKEGMSNKEIHRCLKRYIVRELYPLILADLADSTAAA